MTATSEIIKNLPQFLQQYITKSEKNELEAIVERLKRLREADPGVFDEKSLERYLSMRAQAINELADNYFVCSMSKEFPVVSEKVFNMKRYLTVEISGSVSKVIRDETTQDIDDSANLKISKRSRGSESANTPEDGKKIVSSEVPLFAYTNLRDFGKEVSVGKIKCKLGRSYYYDSNSGRDRARNVLRDRRLEAKLPGSLGQSARAAHREALSRYHRIVSDALLQPTIGDALLQKDFKSPEVGALWIPTLESMGLSASREVYQRKSCDPAMILKFRGKTYFVKSWKTDEYEFLSKYLTRMGGKETN